mgnify:CR=1 FL=1
MGAQHFKAVGAHALRVARGGLEPEPRERLRHGEAEGERGQVRRAASVTAIIW